MTLSIVEDKKIDVDLQLNNNFTNHCSRLHYLSLINRSEANIFTLTASLTTVRDLFHVTLSPSTTEITITYTSQSTAIDEPSPYMFIVVVIAAASVSFIVFMIIITTIAACYYRRTRPAPEQKASGKEQDVTLVENIVYGKGTIKEDAYITAKKDLQPNMPENIYYSKDDSHVYY